MLEAARVSSSRMALLRDISRFLLDLDEPAGSDFKGDNLYLRGVQAPSISESELVNCSDVPAVDDFKEDWLHFWDVPDASMSQFELFFGNINESVRESTSGA